MPECESNAVCDQKFKVIDEDIKGMKNNINDLTDKVNEMDKNVAVKNNEFEIAISNLKTLPDILNSMEKTMIAIQFQTESNKKDNESTKKQVDDIEVKYNNLDDDGKFNIRLWIKQNWFPISIGLFALIIYGANAIK